MAWGRYYKYGYGRTYGRKRRSVKAITMSKSFKASAANMTQNGVFNISVRSSIDHKTPQQGAGTPAIKIDKFDVAQQIASSPMHQQLSNVFDEYKIEKVSIKISPSGHSAFTGSFDINYIDCNLEKLLSYKEKYDISLVSADMSGEIIEDFKPKEGNLAIIIGNEGQGISREVMNLADATVRIPMYNDVESLNASVSAGIIMYSLRK